MTFSPVIQIVKKLVPLPKLAKFDFSRVGKFDLFFSNENASELFWGAGFVKSSMPTTYLIRKFSQYSTTILYDRNSLD